VTRRFSPHSGRPSKRHAAAILPCLTSVLLSCVQDALAAFWAMRAQPGAPSDYLQAELMTELLQQVSTSLSLDLLLLMLLKIFVLLLDHRNLTKKTIHSHDELYKLYKAHV